MGLPKTGSSALQLWLRQNRTALQNFGISYPVRHPTHSNKHVFVKADLLSNRLDMLTEVLTNETCQTMLLSNEGLSNHFYDFTGEALSKFRKLTDGIEKEIILVTRERDAWLRSYHKQCVLNPNNGASDLWATGLRLEDLYTHPRIKDLTDYERLKKNMASGYGADRILHLSYEEDWFGSLLSYLGLSSLQSHRLERINESPPDWAVEILRQINLCALPESERRAWQTALQKYLRSNHSFLIQIEKADWAGMLQKLDLSNLDQVRNASEFCRSSEERCHVDKFAEFIGNTARQVC